MKRLLLIGFLTLFLLLQNGQRLRIPGCPDIIFTTMMEEGKEIPAIMLVMEDRQVMIPLYAIAAMKFVPDDRIT